MPEAAQAQRAESEIYVCVSQIGVALFIRYPELIERSSVGDLAEAPIDLLGAEARLLGGIDEVRRDSCLRDHLSAEHVFHLAGDLVGEPGAAGKQIRDHFARLLGGGEDRIAPVPCKQRGNDDDGARDKPSHEQHKPSTVAHDFKIPAGSPRRQADHHPTGGRLAQRGLLGIIRQSIML